MKKHKPLGPPIYYINLDRRTDRRQFQERQAKLRGLHFVRVAALDGEAGGKRFPASTLTPGAKGLWATFTELNERLFLEGVPAAVILEDDAILGLNFAKRVSQIAREVDDSVAMVQLGFLGLSAWRRNYSFLRNVKKVLRPRSRLRELKSRLQGSGGSETLQPRLGAGTHCLLIFPDRLREHLEIMGPGTLPLDRAFVEYARQNPGVFVRTRKNHAFQLPVESDIPWESAK